MRWLVQHRAALLLLFCGPLFVLSAASFALSFSADGDTRIMVLTGAAIFFFAASSVTWSHFGRYVGLVLCCLFWIYLLWLPIAALPVYVAFPVMQIAIIAVLAVAVSLALPWGEARAERLAERGRAIREWEWVYTGRQFVWRHPDHRLSGGVFCIMVAVALTPVGIWWIYLSGPGGWPAFSILYLGWFYWLTLLALVMRWPFAYPLTFLCLLAGLPFTIPLIVYWADGVRPNFVYRHRFERLVPEGGG